MVEVSNDKRLWDEASKLICPMLRWHDKLGKWVALNEDPCPTRKCNFTTCHNYGKPFHDPKRLIIIKVQGP